MLVQGTWMIFHHARLHGQHRGLELRGVPVLNEEIDGSAPLSIGSILSINSGSRNKDAAACVLDFL